MGEIHVFGTDGSPGVDGHADLVIVQAENAVEDFDLPLRSAFDLSPQVEGRVAPHSTQTATSINASR